MYLKDSFITFVRFKNTNNLKLCFSDELLGTIDYCLSVDIY